MSMFTSITELETKDHYEMHFLEFIEAISRVSGLINYLSYPDDAF